MLAQTKLNIIGIFLGSNLLLASAQSVDAQGLDGLDGIWQGTLKVVSTSNITASMDFEEHPCRLEINGENVRVFFRGNEVKAGAFLIKRHMTNAVISATDSGQDADGTWVETWAFAVTQKDQAILTVSLSWLVNNIDLPVSNQISKLTATAVGEFRETSH